MIATGDTCDRAATIVAVMALLWAVSTLWVIGELRGELEEIERDEEVGP